MTGRLLIVQGYDGNFKISAINFVIVLVQQQPTSVNSHYILLFYMYLNIFVRELVKKIP